MTSGGVAGRVVGVDLGVDFGVEVPRCGEMRPLREPAGSSIGEEVDGWGKDLRGDLRSWMGLVNVAFVVGVVVFLESTTVVFVVVTGFVDSRVSVLIVCVVGC